jgi:hypothetical protein
LTILFISVFKFYLSELRIWMLEFKEFKENLVAISEIKDLRARFKISREELTEHKDRIYNEELYLLRQGMKIKDDLVNSLKQNFENEGKIWLS